MRLGQREGLRVWGGLSRCGKLGVGVASELRQQQGGDTQERGKSKEGALLLSEVSESPCDLDTESLCLWSPSIVTVTSPGASRWDRQGGPSVPRGQAAPRDLGTLLLREGTHSSELSSRLEWDW